MRLKLNTEIFIEKSNSIHNFKYNYSLVNYINAITKINIICNKHGLFTQKPNNHLNGQGCFKCSIRYKSKIIEECNEVFIKKSNLIHHNKYDYCLVKYIGNHFNVIIKCDIHGKFNQNPSNHLNGQGCPSCSIENKSSNTSVFIKKAKLIHNNKYDYSKSIYKRNRFKVIITCAIHGDFKQTPNGHLGGKGCFKCIHTISKPETLWLDSLGILEINRQVKLPNLGNLKVDGYDPSTNTIYEFYGDYWHGNPNKYNLEDFNKSTKCTFKILYDNTIRREEIIKLNGYSLVAMWEHDYIKSNEY